MNETIVASLPALPKGPEFEEFVAAFVQCNGQYVERNVIERQEEEILELDVIATDYSSSGPPKSTLLEAKSGDWGLGDVFKIRGWMDYTGLESGALIVRATGRSIDFCQPIAEGLGVQLREIRDLEHAAESLAGLGANRKKGDADIAIWRFAYWAERQTLRLLKTKKKSHPAVKCYAALEDYFFLVNSRIFFTRNLMERAERLYKSFWQHPHISAKLGNELCGRDFDAAYDMVPAPIYAEAYYEGVLNDLALSTFVEHRARLAVLKDAIDYKLVKAYGDDQNPRFKITVGEKSVEYTLLDLLPSSFKDALDELTRHRYFFRYPVFWQWFLWVFGGFIMKDYENQEFDLLAQKTGVPPEEIPNALQAYEVLFPVEGGWFVENPKSNIRMLKLFPVPLMGIGANYRRMAYSGDGKWESLKVSGPYTLADLKKWNNVAVTLLLWNA